MTAVGALAPEPAEVPQAVEGGRLRWAVSDALVVAGRNLLRFVRIPDAIFFSAVQPVMLVLLFRYVFGGAIDVPGVSYVNYLVAGVYVQTVMFGSMATAVGLAEDLHTGLLERYRALPMARSAVLAGRTIADLVRSAVAMMIITATGYAVGFRVEASVGSFVAGVLVVLLFAHALSWIFAIVGLGASNSEAAQLAAFPVLFPFAFASSAFVPVTTMPGWLQAFTVHQPVSQVVDAARQLMLGGPSPLWSMADVWQALAWSGGLLVVFVPLAIRRYRRVS